MPATRQVPPSDTSSTSRALTSRAELTLIRLRSSTSDRSSTSPARRSNWARLSLVVDVRTVPGPSSDTRSMGRNTSRPPIRAFRPMTGGSSSTWSSLATASAIRPRRSPAESNSGLPANDER